MEKVIITGADGFIGSNLIKELDRQGIAVWAIVHPASKNINRISNLQNVTCIVSDLMNINKRENEFPINADAFYHLAWQGVDANARNDMALQMKNIELCMESIRFASKLKTKKFILPGSTSEYLYYGKPIDEYALPSPQNAYGSVKVALRYIASQYAEENNLEFIYAVITGIYAADRRDNNVIFYVINSLLNNERPSLTKLEQLWDYVNIKDVVQALYLIGEKGVSRKFYAIGHGDNWPLYEYIDVIHKYINKELPIGIGEVPYQRSILPSSCIDLSQLQKDTDFVPKVDFQAGIKEVIDLMIKEKINEK